LTEFATAASRVYFPNYALSDEWSVRRFFNYADELMSDCAAEPGVPTCNLQISIADSGKENSHQHLTVSLRLIDIA